MSRPSPRSDAFTTLVELGNAQRRRWNLIGAVLDEVDKTRTWAHTASSFTEWMRVAAPAIGLKESSLWRYLRAARIYGGLHRELTAQNVTVPELEAMVPDVSAESLELFDKLRRAAPPHVANPVALRLVRGEITRDALRTLWVDYRPAMEGRTAQGRGVQVPTVNRRSAAAADSLMEAEALMALRSGDRGWSGSSSPDVYEVFSHIVLPTPKASKSRVMLDVVVVARHGPDEPLQIHAIEVRSRADLGKTSRQWAHLAEYVDVAWVAVTGANKPDATHALPEDVGVLHISRGHVQVVRSARPTRTSRPFTGDLARHLLALTLCNK